MRLVHKFSAPTPGASTTVVPGVPLAFQFDERLQSFQVWADVADSDAHEVAVMGTGWTLEGNGWVYLATAQRLGLVWHAFYRRASR